MKRQFGIAFLFAIVLAATSFTPTRQALGLDHAATLNRPPRLFQASGQSTSASNEFAFDFPPSHQFRDQLISHQATIQLLKSINEEVLRHPELIGSDGEQFHVDDIRVEDRWALFNLVRFPATQLQDPSLHAVFPDVLLGVGWQNEGDNSSWEVALEGSTAFKELIPQFPESLLPYQSKNILLSATSRAPSSPTAVYTVQGLPWPVNHAWRYNGSWDNSHRAFDFGTPTQGQSAQVYAADSGSVIYSYETCLIVRRGGDNLELLYQHINPSDIANWQIGENLTYAQSVIGSTTVQSGCSGSSTGHHVHFSFRPSGGTYPSSAEGSSVNGWIVVGSELHKGGQVRRPNFSDTVLHTGQANCSAPSQNSPSDGAVLTNRTITFSWNPPSSCTFQGYTFRVCTMSDVANGSGCFIDTGEGGTSRTETINGHDNQDLWWGVRTANPLSPNWAIRRFRIQPETPCPQSGGVLLYWNSNYNCNNDQGDAGYRLRTGTGWQNVNDGSFNDKASSVKVPSGWSVKLFANADRGEPSVCFNNDISDFGTQGNYPGSGTAVNDSVSSMEVFNTSGCGGAPGIPTLASPANGAVFNRNTSITLSWNTSSNASSYYAEMWGGPNASYNSGWTSGTSWAVSQPWGGAYQWRVKARNSAGIESGWSETRSFTVKYGSPTNLSASAVSSSQINLTWNASADAPGNIDGYRIYQNDAAIATVGSSTTSYQNTGLSCETLYSFIVKAYKGSIESDPSNTASVETSSCPLPDLVPYAPTGYDYPVVPSSIKETTIVGPLFAGKPVFFDWHFRNIGGSEATGDFTVRLLVGNTIYTEYPYSNYPTNWTGGFDDWYELHSQAGCQTVKLIVDPDNTIVESNEANNTWQREFCWQSVNGWWGEYFNNETLAGDPVFVRDDPAIDFDWEGESPAPGINSDHFSIRWTRSIAFEEGTYRFAMFRDDGARLWIEDVLVFEEWEVGREYNPVEYEISSGLHDIRYEVNEIDGWAAASLDWELITPCNDQNEPNNSPGAASEMGYGDSVEGDICPVVDEDFFKFNGTSGQMISADISAEVNGSLLESELTLIAPDGSTILAGGWDDCGVASVDKTINYTLPTDGVFFIKVDECSDYSDHRYFYTLTLTAVDTNPKVYVSPTGTGVIAGISFTGADILSYTKATNTWDVLYDGSSANTPKNVGAFAFDGDDILLGFSANQAVPGLGTFAAQDLARFMPTSLGYNNTAGTFGWFFDGSDVGLSLAAETLDALWIDDTGRLYISTTGSGVVPANSSQPSGTKVKFQDEDILRFTPSSTGATTAGTWSLYWNPTSITGMSAEDINGYWEDPATGARYVIILGAFNVGNAAYGGKFAGTGKTILRFVPNAAAPGGWAPAEIVPWLAAGATFPSTIDGIEMKR